MAQIAYRGNLSANSFPFLSENWGRTVIVPGSDNNYNRKITSTEDSDKDIGIPQIFYCHNVLPFAQGFKSVGYNEIYAKPGTGEAFNSQSLIRDDLGNKAYLIISTTGNYYINEGVSWSFKGNFGTGAVSIAYVSGITYIWIRFVGCYKYDFTTHAFVSVSISGLTLVDTGVLPEDIIGIAPSFGYLLLYTTNTVLWSSTIDPTDFVPSLATGAGNTAVEGVRGSITFCLPHTLGFMVYTESNVVVALYSGNARYPFNFRELVNSGGCASSELVSYDSNSGDHYAYTTSGLQKISTQAGQTVFPELTDFISGRLFEDFDDETKTFSAEILTQPLAKKVTVVADRYLVVSYGITELTHALVYDLIQKRWGKLKIRHTDCFENVFFSPGVVELPKQSMSFLLQDGSIQSIDLSIRNSNGVGCLLLGKFQYVRARLLQIDEITVENVHSTNFFLSLYTSLDGKTGTWNYPMELGSAGTMREYVCREIGLNHSLLLQGDFNLISFELKFIVNARK